MKPDQIKEGHVYRNGGQGKTTRRVIEISNDARPNRWLSTHGGPPDEPGVRYEQLSGRNVGHIGKLYLPSFAAWAGSEVES